MPRVYDNWVRLVEATLDREKLHELALADSRETSFSSSISSRLSYHFNFKFKTGHPGYVVKDILSCTRLTSQVIIHSANVKTPFRKELRELKHKTRKLKSLIYQADCVSGTLYDRPYSRIMDDTEEVLHKAAGLVMRCTRKGCDFTNAPTAALQTMSSKIEDCIRNVSWLLRDNEDYLDSPPFAADEPSLCYVWQLIAIIATGSEEDQVEAAASLVSLVEDDVYRTLIIEEGGVQALLRLLEQGQPEGQEYAARAIGLLGKDPDSVDQIISAGTCILFARVLREGPINVKAMVMWAVSELAENNPQCQTIFAFHNFHQLLIHHLSCECMLNTIAMSCDRNNVTSQKEDVSTHDTKAIAARALCQLAKGDDIICEMITDSGALFQISVLLDQGSKQARYNSVMVLTEISAAAETNESFRRSRFGPNSAVCQAIVKKLFKMIEMEDSEFLVPCIRTLGNFARIFSVTDTKMIDQLVKLLNDKSQVEIAKETCITLSKFALYEHFLNVEYSNAIIDAGGASHLVKLMYSGDNTIQLHALILLCYISVHLPERAIHTEIKIAFTLEWASKQAHLKKYEDVKLWREARTRLKLCESRLCL